jgi:hypothetical protein
LPSPLLAAQTMAVLPLIPRSMSRLLPRRVRDMPAGADGSTIEARG